MRYVVHKPRANNYGYVDDASFLPNLIVDDIPLDPTGILCPEGYMICREPVMGFHRDYQRAARGSKV